MGINKLPKLSDYWSSNPVLGNTMIKSIMSRDRFFQILRCFHLSNRSTELKKNDEEYYLLQKVDPFMSELKGNFGKHFTPSRNISIDEALIKFKGRLGIIQYMPLKPAKRGIKIWMMCSSFLGYVINFDVYCGRNDKIPRSGKGLGYDVVLHLIQRLKSKGHNIYFDRFFTSVRLQCDLLSLGQYSCGTVMPNRKFLPKGLSKLKLKNPGDSKCFQCIETPNLLCTVWKDKKEITMLSTQCKNETVTVSRRFGGDKITVSSPVCFQSYNKHMGGVDLADQMRKYYSISRKSRKWWHYLFWFLLDTAIFNSFILFTLSNMPLNKRPMRYLDFKMELIKDMSAELKKSDKKSLKRKANYNNDNTSHKKIKIDGRKKNCRRCSKLKVKTSGNYPVSSSYMCEACQICLCLNCFGPYHDELYPK